VVVPMVLPSIEGMGMTCGLIGASMLIIRVLGKIMRSQVGLG